MRPPSGGKHVKPTILTSGWLFWNPQGVSTLTI
jgi:hypothetical protein